MKTVNISLCLGVIVCGLIATRTPLHAQAVDAPNIAGSDDMPWNKGVTEASRAAAREAFLEGNRLFKIPLFSQAVEKYEEALDKWKHPAFYFNLAIAQINLGQYLEARESLERALKYGAEPLRTDRFEEAKKQLVEVQRHLGRIRVSCPTPGAEVTLDAITLFTGPGQREVWVRGAATHEITAKNPDYLSESRRLTVNAGELKTVELKLITLGEIADASRRWATWKPWAVVTAGASVTAAGGVFHALASRNFSYFDTNFQKQPCATQVPPKCPDRMVQAPAPSDLYERLDSAGRERRIALGGYIAGGALIATGAMLLYMNRPRLPEQDATSTPTIGIAVAPAISGNMLGVLANISY